MHNTRHVNLQRNGALGKTRMSTLFAHGKMIPARFTRQQVMHTEKLNGMEKQRINVLYRATAALRNQG